MMKKKKKMQRDQEAILRETRNSMLKIRVLLLIKEIEKTMSSR